MYTNFYSLTANPFESNPDSRFLYLGEKHKEALALMLFAIREKKALVLLSGEAGMGKTTLVNLLMRLEPAATYALIVNPTLALIDFYRLMFHDFGIHKACSSKADYLIALDEFLNERYEAGKQIILIVDEAQGLSTKVLQEIRYILNIGARYPGSLQIILSGQPEIKETIARESLQNLQQRILLHANLTPFDERETRAYIEKRLTEAGNPKEKQLFAPESYLEIARLSGGIPRIINSLCECALLLGHLQRLPQINREIIVESIKDLDFLKLPGLQTPPPAPEPQTPRRGWFRRLFDANG